MKFRKKEMKEVELIKEVDEILQEDRQGTIQVLNQQRYYYEEAEEMVVPV